MSTPDLDSDTQVPNLKYGYGKVQDLCKRLNHNKPDEVQNRVRAYRKNYKDHRSPPSFPLIYSEPEAQECAQAFINQHGDLFEDSSAERERLINRVARLMCTQEAFQRRNDAQNGVGGKRRGGHADDNDESGNESDTLQFAPKRPRTEAHNTSRRRRMRSRNRGSGSRLSPDPALPEGHIESPTPSPPPPSSPRLKLILENPQHRLDTDDPLSAEVFKLATLQQFFDMFCRRSNRVLGSVPSLTFTPSWPDHPFEVASTDTDAAWEAAKEDIGIRFIEASKIIKDHKFRLRVRAPPEAVFWWK